MTRVARITPGRVGRGKRSRTCSGERRDSRTSSGTPEHKTRTRRERFDGVHSSRAQVSAGLRAARAGLRALKCDPGELLRRSLKIGVAQGDALALARAVAQFERLRLRGLMAIPEPTRDAAVQRARFREVRELYEQLRADGLTLDTLSLGMSDDLEAAIAEGSTLVRVGTAIFGARRREKDAA